MAAEVLLAAGLAVDLYDAMPSVGRKFLLAGKGGLNLTHAEPFDDFVQRYGARAALFKPWLSQWGAEQAREWARGLGVETFVGTSQRVFPADLKAAPLLRAWLHRLRQQGLRVHVRHRWQGWDAEGHLVFETPAGLRTLAARCTVLALGGASWPQLGSDGRWVEELLAQGADIAPIQASNCGFGVSGSGPELGGGDGAGWSAFLRERFAGAPLKNVRLSWANLAGQSRSRIGECVLTAHGLEGSLIYAASADLRDCIHAHGSATLTLDLLPAISESQVAAEVGRPRGARSMGSHLQSRLKLTGAKAALLRELAPPAAFGQPAELARFIKALPVRLEQPRPVAEAISTAGGVRFECLTDDLMLRAKPGVFIAGEMLDWEAPTGGYLLTAALSTGRLAGEGAARWCEPVVQSGTPANPIESTP
jgi:uncharacterized flavoprotein (TIGR03862 family)